MGARSTRGGKRWTLVVALALATAACGLGDKAAIEDTITTSPRRLEAGPVAGTLTVESRLFELPPGGTGGIGVAGAPGIAQEDDVELPEEGIPFGSTSVDFVLDLAGDRVALSEPGADRPFVYVDGLEYFGRRAGVPDDDARPWVRLDLEDVDDGAGEVDPFGGDAPNTAVSLHLGVVTDLLAGTLTGSIDEVGAETVDGVETTHYEVNVAVDKALGDARRFRYPEDRREVVERLLELHGIDGIVHRGEVWLDEEGNVRRFSVALRQAPAPRVEFALVVTVDYGPPDVGGELELDLPTPEEVLSVDSVVRFVRTVVERDRDEGAIPPSLAATLAPAVGAADGPGDEPAGQPGDGTQEPAP